MSALRVIAGRVYRFIRVTINNHVFRRRPAENLHRVVNPFRVPLIKRRPPPVWRSNLFRSFRVGVKSARFTNLRSALLSPWMRGAIGRGATGGAGLIGAAAGVSFIGFQDSPVDSLFDRIREYFKNDATLMEPRQYPRLISGYDIGGPIAKGCNGIVYEARLRRNPSQQQIMGTFGRVIPAISSSQKAKQLLDAQRSFPLAVKMMFNYDTTSNEDLIVREMGAELVPCSDTSVNQFIKWHQPFTGEHPNVVKIITAFVDSVPALPEAERLYPAALPSHLHDEGIGRNKTLFILMKRYTMTLREYLLLKHVDIRTCQILLGQLLEAVAFLTDLNISHRDLKSNNVLVDFNEENEPPHLVVADFGCCLSRGTLTVHYPHYDVDLGGNLALRAPEIVRTSPGRSTFLDFSKADLWAAGTLALEIFTKVNPFYLDHELNKVYNEADLPSLPKPAPASIVQLVKSLLKINPDDRPTPLCAANVVALSLFNVGYLHDVLNRLGMRLDFGSKKWAEFRVSLGDVISLYAAETIIGRLPDSNRRISDEESKLRSVFLSRIDSASLLDAVQFFLTK